MTYLILPSVFSLPSAQHHEARIENLVIGGKLGKIPSILSLEVS